MKYGRLQRAAFSEPGGDALRKWIDDCPNQLYAALTFMGGAVWRDRLMNDLAAAGKAVIMISSELPEVLGMADRIVVMHEGRIAGEIVAPRQATQADVLALAIGRPIDTQEPR